MRLGCSSGCVFVSGSVDELLCKVVDSGALRGGASPSPLRDEMTVSERMVTGVGKDWT